MSETDGYPTETHGNIELPSPGRWRLNWATGQVASWYYGETKTSESTFAHFYDTPTACYVEIGDERVDIDGDTRTERHEALAAALRRHAPDEP